MFFRTHLGSKLGGGQGRRLTALFRGLLLASVVVLISGFIVGAADGPSDQAASQTKSTSTGRPSPSVGVIPGLRAPDFTATDLRGGQFKLSDFRGKIVLLDFWASWCRPCMNEMPTLTRIKNKYPEDKFTIVGVSLDQKRTAQRMHQVVAQNELTYPIAYDGKGWENQVWRLYSSKGNMRGIPATFVLDGEGIIIARDKRGEELERLLDSLLLPKGTKVPSGGTKLKAD